MNYYVQLNYVDGAIVVIVVMFILLFLNLDSNFHFLVELIKGIRMLRLYK